MRRLLRIFAAWILRDQIVRALATLDRNPDIYNASFHLSMGRTITGWLSLANEAIALRNEEEEPPWAEGIEDAIRAREASRTAIVVAFENRARGEK